MRHAPAEAAGGVAVRRRARLIDRTFSVPVEAAFVAAWLFAFQLVKVPLESTPQLAVENARCWLDLEQALNIAVEADVIELARGSALYDVLLWWYDNAHISVIFGFLVAARIFRPERYAPPRTPFVLFHLR